MKLTASNVSITNTVVTSKMTLGGSQVVEGLSVGDVSINSSTIAVGSVSLTPTAILTPSLIVGGVPFGGGMLGGIVDYKEFTANSTWYNPYANASVNASLTGYEQVLVMAWGGGGGGNTAGGAGGGGACLIGHGALNSFSNTCAVTIGIGGTGTQGAITNGGNSIFVVNSSSSMIAYGGGAGQSAAGGGGGVFGVGTLNGGGPLGGSSATPGGTSTYGGGGGVSVAGAGLGGSSVFGGGGGARPNNTSLATGSGGASIYGGGGGAGLSPGGSSVFGGRGANSTVAASIPGGGGSGNTNNSFGARGEVRVWVIGPGSTTAGAPTYTLTANTTTLYEGSSVLYTVSTTNVANNTTLYYTLNNSSTAVSTDFTTAVNSSVTVVNGTGTFTLSAVDDSDLSNETIQMNIRTGSSTGTIVASNGSVSVVPLPAVSVINRSTFSGTGTSSTTYTFSAMATGTASATRRVIAVIFGDDGSAGGRTLSSASIGGISATIDAQATHTSGGSGIVAVVSATVPTGTTADVIAIFSGGIARAGCWVVAIDNLISVTPYDTLTATSTMSGTINWLKDGFVVGGSCTNDDTQNFTWSGLTERVEGSYGTADAGAADLLTTTTATNQTVSSTSDGAGTRKTMVVVSYR